MATGKLGLKLIVLLFALIILSILYIIYSMKHKTARKLAEKIENDPKIALELSNKLNSFFVETDFNFDELHDKLSRLKYELEISYHWIIKCHAFNSDTFLIMTTYEHLDTSKSDSVEKVIPLNYKFCLDKTANKVRIYSDNADDLLLNGFKRTFVKGFFKKYMGKNIEI